MCSAERTFLARAPSYVEPGYALRLLEDHPDGAGYLLKERVLGGAVLIDALRRWWRANA